MAEWVNKLANCCVERAPFAAPAISLSQVWGGGRAKLIASEWEGVYFHFLIKLAHLNRLNTRKTRIYQLQLRPCRLSVPAAALALLATRRDQTRPSCRDCSANNFSRCRLNAARDSNLFFSVATENYDKILINIQHKHCTGHSKAADDDEDADSVVALVLNSFIWSLSIWPALETFSQLQLQLQLQLQIRLQFEFISNFVFACSNLIKNFVCVHISQIINNYYRCRYCYYCCSLGCLSYLCVRFLIMFAVNEKLQDRQPRCKLRLLAGGCRMEVWKLTDCGLYIWKSKWELDLDRKWFNWHMDW